MRNLEDVVRVAVLDLADDAPMPRDLAAVARVRGRRMRRRRRATVGVVTALLVGAVVTPYVFLQDRRAAPRPAPVASIPPSRSAAPAPTTEVTAPAIRKDWWNAPVTLPGGVVVTSVGRRMAWGPDGSDLPARETAREGNVALDPATGRYRVFPSGYQMIVGAPAGRYAFAEDAMAQVRVLDTTSGRERRLGHGSGSGAMQWSADGRQLMLSLLAGDVRLIDPGTGRAVDRRIEPRANTLCPDFCFFTHLPGGREIALPQRDLGVPRSEDTATEVSHLKVYSLATGKLLRTLPVPGVPVGSAAWSPDGRHVVVLPDGSETSGLRVVEVATGRVVGLLRGVSGNYPAVSYQVRFLGNGQVLAVSGQNVEVYDLTGKLRGASRLPADFAGREVALGAG